MSRQNNGMEQPYGSYYDSATNQYRIPPQKVIGKGKSGGSFLVGFALIVTTLILTLGVIVGLSMISTGSGDDEVPAEETEQIKPKETKGSRSTAGTIAPVTNIDKNGESTGQATAEDTSADNPTQTFFASKGTLSDVAELGYLGQKLNEEEQRLYLQLHAAISGGRENVDMIEVYDENSIKQAWECLFADHPEFFWLDGQYQYRYDPNAHTLSVQFGVGVPLYEMSNYRQQIENKAIEFQNSIPADASQYEIALKAYEYIVLNTKYDESAPYNQNIVSVFLNGRSVCAGYARAYQYLLHRAGLFCSFVHGNGHTESGVDESHAWNLICIDGIYAFVDTTWGDKNPKMIAEGQADWGDIRYAYFGMPTKELLATGHSFTTPEWWPQCDSYDLNIYKREGLLWEGYNRAYFHQVIQTYIAEGRNSMEFQFTTTEAWQACMTDVNTEECLKDLPDWMGTHRASWSFLSNDTTRTVRFTWQED